MKTLSYVLGQEREIEIGQEYYFGQLWDGEDGNADEILESKSVSLDGENTVSFEIIENAENQLETRVKIIDIY